MADSYTTNLSLTKPEPGASADSWGGKLNDNFDDLDAIFKSDGTGTSVGLNVGSGKTLTISGSATAPTQSASDNSTKLSTTAFVATAIAAAKQALYPVGSIYINASSTTNPATLLGFGTWVAFGSGKVLVGQDTADTSFDVLEETGGSKNAIVVSHTHTTTGTDGTHTHYFPGEAFGVSSGSTTVTSYSTGSAYYNGFHAMASDGTHNGQHSHTLSTEGSSGTNANLPPYIVVKMWKRTA